MSVSLRALSPPWSEERIRASLRDGGRALIALSGGVDSAVTALLARRALGTDLIAVTLTGPAVSAREVDESAAVARAIEVPHVFVPVDPLRLPEYRANPEDRCFHCRTVESAVLLEFGQARGIRQYLDGVHRDDLGENRPGLRALDAAGFRHPLADAGWGKSEVRSFARANGLPNWDRPSNACLASRVAHGSPISEELLRRVDAAEEWLAAQGFRRVRVRVDGARARVEVGADEVPRLLEPARARAVTEALHEFGFLDVTLDPRGYRPAGGP
jgi:uncharacterized protein